MNRSEHLESWILEEQRPFAGWDFSHLDGRMVEDPHPWSYVKRAGQLLQQAQSVVDLDTGGGERYGTLLKSHKPRLALTTENYPPNTRLAHNHLAAAGATVIRAKSDEITPLPFASDAFDLILNRHGAFNADEIARVLAPGGTFLTKQVHGLWAHDLLAVFGARPQWPDATPARYVPMLEEAGLTIVTLADWRGALRFTDVGAIVYYLRAVPWLVPGFSVRTHQAALFRLQDQLEADQPLTFFAGTYLIEAQRNSVR